MSFKFGWENYATGYSDFEIHRAQQKHYDAFTSVMVETGPGTWTLPSGGYSSGSSGSSGSDSGGGVTVHNQGRVTKGPAAGVELSNGKFTFRESKLIDKSDVDGDFDNMELTQVMHPEVTAGKAFNLTWEASPYFSDIEEWAEKRYGDIGGAFLAPVVFLGDAWHNAGRAIGWASRGSQEAFGAGAPNFNIHTTVVGSDGHVYRTGGGF